MRLRRLGLLAVAVLAAAAAGWLALSARRPPAPAVVAPPPVRPSQEPPAAAAPVPEAPRPDRQALVDAFAAIPVPESIGLAAAREYRERARYPRWSHPVPGGTDPVLRDREVTPGASLPADATPRLFTRPAQVSFESPDPVVVIAYLADGAQRLPPRELRGEVRDAAGRTLARLDFRDDGRAGDARAGDGVHTASFTPGADGVEELQGAYLFEVVATTSGGEVRAATSGFLYSVPQAHLTGLYRDSISGGNLLIEARVEVLEEARFHLEATLGAADGVPIAWAQNAVVLEPGERWIPLTFYGLVLRESERDGPYRLLSVALSSTDEMPNRKNDVVRDAHETAAYANDDFSDRPFGDADLIEAAERLERELR